MPIHRLFRKSSTGALMAVSLWQSSRMASQTLVDGNTVADRLQRYVERPSPYWLALASEGVYSLSKPVNLQKISIASKTSEKNLDMALSEFSDLISLQNEMPIPDGWKHWKLDEIVRFDDKTDSYVGMVFKNTHTKQMILAYRGSYTARDWLTNLDLVRKQLSKQFIEGMIHALITHRRAQEAGYHLSLTGHSLGGALAIAGLYAIKRSQPTILRQADYTHAVTFDNPGMKDFLEKLEPKLDDRILLDDLNVTCYLSSRPNLVNSCGSHVGTVISLKIDEKDDNSTNLFGHTLKYHKMSRLLNAFLPDGSINTQGGWQAVWMSSWPSIQFKDNLTTDPIGFKLAMKEITDSISTFTRGIRNYLHKWLKGNYKNSFELIEKNVIPAIYLSNWHLAETLQILAKIAEGFVYEIGCTRLSDTDYLESQPLQSNTAVLENYESIYHTTDDCLQHEKLKVLLHTPERRHSYTLNNAYPKRQIPLVLRNLLKRFGDNEFAGFRSNPDLPEFLQKEQADILACLMSPTEPGNLSYIYDDDCIIIISEEANLPNPHEWMKQLIDKLNKTPDYLATYPTKTFTSDIIKALVSQQPNTLKSYQRRIVEKRIPDCWSLLADLSGLYSASRLYLFGSAPVEDLDRHSSQLDALKDEIKQLAVEQKALQQDIATIRTESHAQIYTALSDDIKLLTELLKLAYQLSQGFYYLKVQQPDLLLDYIIPLLEETPELKSLYLSDQKMILLNELAKSYPAALPAEIFKGCAYALVAKAYRQKCHPKMATEDQQNAVISNYKNALACFKQTAKKTPQPRLTNDIAATQSSLASFYDDLGQSSKAKHLHKKALNLLTAPKRGIDLGEIGNDRWAVTASNRAGNFYQLAIAKNDDVKNQLKYLNEAKILLDRALKLYPNGGSYLYRSEVQQLQACLTHGCLQIPSDKDPVLEDIEAGLLIEPENIRLILAKTKYHKKAHSWQDAETSVNEAIALLYGTRDTLPEHTYFYNIAKELQTQIKDMRAHVEKNEQSYSM